VAPISPEIVEAPVFYRAAFGQRIADSSLTKMLQLFGCRMGDVLR
jgi:hypothetical protein